MADEPNGLEGLPPELAYIIKIITGTFVISVIAGVAIAFIEAPDEASKNLSYYIAYPFLSVFGWIGALIASIELYLIGSLALSALLIFIYMLSEDEELEPLIAQYCPSGPFFATPADLIPKQEFMQWKERKEDFFAKPSEQTKTGDFWVRDWASYLKSERLKDALLLPRPFGFTDELRFRAQFIVGDSGSGKTTYLSNQLKADLDRVATGECTLFVMDSKNELIPNLARLNRFQPGGDLDGKLLYIEPSDDLALNLFEVNANLPGDLQRRARQEALQIITFFLGSVVEMEASSHQETLLKYVIPAVLECPNPTILTLQDILSDEGYVRLRPHFAHLRQTEWLDEHLLPKKEKTRTSGSFAITRDALRFRIAGIVADDVFYHLFSRPKSSIDFYEALSEPKVILVNTLKGELGGATAGFGTFFIAKLMQVAQERTLANGTKLPVFAFIDEATEYLGKNPAVNELVNKARSQHIGLTIAVQGTEEIGPTVLAALRRAAIQAFNGSGKGGTWDLSIEKRIPATIHVPPFSFEYEPHIELHEFGKVRKLMHWTAQSTDPVPDPARHPALVEPMPTVEAMPTVDPHAPTED